MSKWVAGFVLMLYSVVVSLAIPLFVRASLKVEDRELRRRRLILAKHLVFLLWLIIPSAALMATSYSHILLIGSPLVLPWAGLAWLLNVCIHAVFEVMQLRSRGVRVRKKSIGMRGLLLELRDQLYYIGLPEEMLFRGIMVGVAMSLIGIHGAIMLSSTLFGLGHLIHERRIARFIETFLTSTIYSIGLIFAGSVWAPAIAHILVNLFFASVSLEPAHS
ncbi:MAG: hypothetical protein DRN15_07110 [Thermoprotei archaeon]|nr:MAG: hypothetical protein DRN15_07110 [Thermoprotei archaeon]